MQVGGSWLSVTVTSLENRCTPFLNRYCVQSLLPRCRSATTSTGANVVSSVEVLRTTSVATQPLEVDTKRSTLIPPARNPPSRRIGSLYGQFFLHNTLGSKHATKDPAADTPSNPGSL